MKLYGRLLKQRYVLVETLAEETETTKPFIDRLEWCIRQVCKSFDISVPIWLDRNTSEFACFKRTTFTPEQFIDNVNFDRFEIEIILD